MILADTSVVIDFLRTGDATMRQIIVNQIAAVCGITRAEVLHGARDAKHRARLLQGLSLFQRLPIPDALWDEAGDNLAALRGAGVTVPFADGVIATVAIENDLELWTRDARFALMQPVLPRLRLFQETP